MLKLELTKLILIVVVVADDDDVVVVEVLVAQTRTGSLALESDH